jgi:hypothetical protein
MFEERMNPFTAFHRNQRKLQHAKLSTAEKITLTRCACVRMNV